MPSRPDDVTRDSSEITEVPASPTSAERPWDALVREDRYEMLSVLGRGGMGEVHLARDTRFGREIAMKVIRSGGSSYGEAAGRFVREARIQGRLDHPAVVPVHDVAIGPLGIYFTMKRVRGVGLDVVLAALARGDAEARARWTQRRLLSAFASVCLAVDFAHAHGVLHRDIKPSNIMLGDFGEVHLLDWGVAKVLGKPEAPADGRSSPPRAGEPSARVPALSDDPSDSSLTRQGSIVGTPGYLSPEQARGEVAGLDARTDVHALGEILTLQRLHPAGDVLEALKSARSMRAVERPSERAPDRAISPELDAACTRALAFDPDERFASARELADAVERHLDGDRDLETRRALSARAAEEAGARAEEASRAGPGAVRAHQMAIAAATRALALDADNEAAAGLLARLFLEMPRECPPEARAELTEHLETRNRAGARLAVARLIAVVLLVVTALTGRVTSVPWLVVAGLLAVASVATTFGWIRAHGGAPRSPLALASHAITVALVAMLGGAFGPMILVPVLVLLQGLIMLLACAADQRRAVILTNAAGMVVPLLLEAFDLLPRGLVVTEGAILAPARAVAFHPAAVTTFLLFIHVMVVSGPLVILAGFLDHMGATDEKVFLQAWHLRRLGRLPARGTTP